MQMSKAGSVTVIIAAGQSGTGQLQATGSMPHILPVYRGKPLIELIAVLLPRFGQLGARVFAQRVCHALDQPRWHDDAAQNAELLTLQMMDDFMPDVVGLPCIRADHNSADGSNGDRRPSTQAELIGAILRRTENHQRMPLDGADTLANKQERLVVERVCFWKPTGSFNADGIAGAVHAHGNGDNDANWLHDEPGRKRNNPEQQKGNA